MSAATNPWLTRMKAVPAPRARVLCFPFAGGTSAVYRAWQDRFSADVEVCAVNFPGRGSRFTEPPIRRMDAMLDGLCSGLTPFLDRPFAVFGHSLGAVIAFEWCRLLPGRGLRSPLRLFASGARGPQLPDPYSPIHHLPPDEFVHQMQVRYAGIPAEILAEPDLLALLLPPLQADLELFETYAFRQGPALDFPVTVFGGRQDHRLDDRQYQAWRQVTTRPVDFAMFDGGHFFVQESAAEVASAVARTLARDLDGA